MKIPKQVIIEVSRTCNLRCVGCPINADEDTGSAVFMDVDFFKSIIDRIVFSTVVIPWMNGEPLMHPDIAEMYRYVSAAGNPWYLTTNGHFWNEEVFDHIFSDEGTCYQVIVSLDGLPGSASITAARPGSDGAKVVDTIQRLIALKRATGSKVDIAVKAVERGQDWQELEEYILFWLGQGVDYVCVGRMLSQETPVPMRRHPCQYFDNNFMVIRHDGELVLCAYNDRVVNKGENALFKIDSQMPLLEAYNSVEYNGYRDAQNNGRYPGPCASCGFAYTGHGMIGDVRFRVAPDLKVFHRRDYYNSFYSLKDRHKPDEYYVNDGLVLDASTYYEEFTR